MGLKGPPLPAPTETDSNTGREETELESRVTDKTTYSLPSDGSPVTIPTKKRDKGKGLTSNKSQTSLLIEYFEGGRPGQPESRKPSVRVKVTPSSKSRSRLENDHIQITERKGTRKPSYTKRIQLSPHVTGDGSPAREEDDTSLLSYRSATEESNVTSRGGRPIEVEIMPRRHGSPLIPTGESSSKFVHPTASDISSMPADSFLDGKTTTLERKRSRSLSRGQALAAGAATGLVAGAIADKLKSKRSRSLSRERIVVQKAAEKVRGDKSERRRKHRSRSRSVSGEHLTEGIKSPRRRSSRSHHDDSNISGGTGAGSSLLTSQVSGRSGDQYSVRSGTSKASINNPKLLETVEDAIRRLILPELTALKRDQSQRLEREQRDRRRRGSLTSGSAVSRDSIEESSSVRRSDRGSGTDLSSKPRVTLNDEEVVSSKSRKEKNKNLDRIKLEDSPGSFERETSEETVVQDGDRSKKKKHRGLEAAALAAGVGALTAAALHKHHSQDSISLDEKQDRRRRRTKSRSRSDSMTESYEEREHVTAPPMPLMSDINASELTRSSILSAETERPHSASQEHQVTPVREVSRGIASPSSLTPTRTPIALQQGLGTQHSNYSRGNLSLHSQPSDQHLRTDEYELDEHGRKVPMHGAHDDEYLEEEEHRTGGRGHALAAGLVGAAAGAGLATMYHRHQDHDDPELLDDDDHYDYYQNHQEVPPPLKYVPYGHQGRGLSPIQSVSGYTEGDPEPQRDSRLTHSTGSYSSMGKSAQHRHSGRSMRSLDSAGDVHGNRHDFPGVRQGGLTDSELTQDGEYWEEQHRENDRNREMDAESYRSSDPRIDYKHLTNFTDDSMDVPRLDHVAAGQNVRGVGANPDYVHTPLAVESAVASLVNASDLTGPTGHYDRRGSYASFDDGSELQFTSRGNSPTKRNTFGSSQGASSQQNSPDKYIEEYDLDEQGRKVAMPNYKKSHAAGNAVLAGIAAGAAAHVLKGRKTKSDADQIHYESVNADTGAPLHKSFKERAMEGQGQVPLSPRHSIDAPLSEASHEHLKMTASGIPDSRDPMPEIGYGDGESEVDTNPSIIQGPIGGVQGGNQDHWPAHPTPPQKHQEIKKSLSAEHDANVKAAEAALVGAAVGAGATALAGHNRDVSRETNEEDWQRTSGDRKRDTLITNPYEGTSPIAAIGNNAFGLQPNLLGAREFAATQPGYQTGSPGALPKDEGYISSAPNAGAISPEPRIKGVNFLDQELDGQGGENPFYTPKHARHLSGMSAGMESPLYDSATGNGMDRIQSRDIIALMDHLTVRDAQRSARDTEILVTLVRVAAEMRNSFTDMRNLLGDSEDVIINEVQMNTDRSVQKAINGPRPIPPSATRSLRQGSQDEMYEDPPTKRRNVFRRALKGLSMKSSNDLGKIEDMLVQLLGDVEGLKVAQGLKPGMHSADSYDDLRQEGNYENDRGYEPEGNAGTSTASHASQSGHLSLPLSRGTSATRGYDARKFSDHRISTVPEGDEDELDPHEQAVLDNAYENNEQLLTPTRENIRGGSAPLGTPPQQQVALASLSNENTPRTDKSKKHKSSSSSGWIPKVSRWSETTASTVLRGFRNSGRSSGRKENDQFAEPRSRSGSDLGNYNDNDPYGDDELQYSPEHHQHENEPPVSLLPPEDPKYKAKRISLTIEHPQPRPGPTHRYQTALESQAVNFDTPMSPTSANWSQTSLNRLPPPVNTNRYSDGTNNTGHMSPASDGAYSHHSASHQPPARPLKEQMAPQLQPKLRTKLQKPSPLGNEHLSPERQYSPGGYDQGGSPRPAIRSLSGTLGGAPARKPTGPRSMSSASKSGELSRDDGAVRRNRNRDTFGTIASTRSAESETF